jgi:hypothetical protein
LRQGLAVLPRAWRFALFRRLVDCDPAPDARLVVRIAETKEDLEACFALLHDAYVASGFMQPHPSGLRVTPYHALPTTTTICALWDGRVVGTISMLREGVFGFPLQQVFDLAKVRAKGGNIAEVSALAVHADFRATGGTILFPLLKFMYEYSTHYFDTQHLVIAVHPSRIEMYESLLFFERLQSHVVAKYDFANGAPAIGATLDLRAAPALFQRAYAGKTPRQNLFGYFTELKLANLHLPERRYFVTNDPVLTPELFDHFFNRRVQVLAALPLRQRELLHSIYDLDSFTQVLPPRVDAVTVNLTRRHQRFSIRLPARLVLGAGDASAVAMDVVEMSLHGFQAECLDILPLDRPSQVTVDLGQRERSVMRAVPIRRHAFGLRMFYGFRVDSPDGSWRRCVEALEHGLTRGDLLGTA